MQHIDQRLAAMADDSAIADRTQAYAGLRALGLNDFGSVLWSMPDARFPRLSALFPAMVSADVQRRWTGQAGYQLLAQSVCFMRSAAANYAGLTGSGLAGKRILDFGCGYGRLLRLAAFYSDDVFGVDPGQEVLGFCKRAGLVENIELSDYLPSSLPVPADFDFAYAFSVFTHLSERATKTCLAALRKHMKPEAILCITIRPVEYWRVAHAKMAETELQALERRHQDEGFAFFPHNRPAVDGDVTYGDTSMTLEWLGQAAGADWKIEAVDRCLEDGQQRYVFLRAA